MIARQELEEQVGQRLLQGSSVLVQWKKHRNQLSVTPLCKWWTSSWRLLLLTMLISSAFPIPFGPLHPLHQICSSPLFISASHDLVARKRTISNWMRQHKYKNITKGKEKQLWLQKVQGKPMNIILHGAWGKWETLCFCLGWIVNPDIQPKIV